MLSSADADLARRDAALPGLATLLDPEAFAARISGFLPDGDPPVARVTYARHKPGKSCVVGYRMKIGASVAHLYAKVSPSSARTATVREGKGLLPPQGSGRFVLDDGATTVCVFPTDHKLKGIRHLVDPAMRRRLLRKLVPDRDGLWGGTIEGLRYMPERRYVSRLTCGGRPVAVLKVYTEREYPSVRAKAGMFESG